MGEAVARRSFDRARAGAIALLLARRTLVVGAGYGIATGTATVVTVAHMVLPSVFPDDGAWGSLHAYMRDWPMLLFGGLSITVPTALPGFLVTVALAAWRNWRDPVTFALAGGLDALAALWIFSGGGGGGMPLESLFFTFCCFGGGLAGGFSYWVAAESWREIEPRRPSAPPHAPSRGSDTMPARAEVPLGQRP